MGKKCLIDRSKNSLSNVLSHATELQIQRGEGAYLIDYKNKRYLDFGAGIAVNSTGIVIQALLKQFKISPPNFFTVVLVWFTMIKI